MECRDSRSIVVVLFSLFLLSGCAKLGPDFSPPEALTSAGWLEIQGQRIRAEQADYRQWWKVLKDPVLERLIQSAYEQNLPLRTVGLRIYEARAQLGVAVGGWYPQLQQTEGGLSYDRQSEYGPGGISQGRDLSSSQLSFGVGASWELDFWGKFRRSIEAADATLLSSIAEYDQAIVSLVGNVASAYLQIRISEERLRIARGNVATQGESLKIARARFEGGASGERDLQQALTQLHNTEAVIPQLEAALRQTKNALSVLLGMPPADLTDLLAGSQGIPQAQADIAIGIPADLIRRRPDIRQAELQAAAQSALIGALESDLYPAFSLTGSFGFLASDAGSADLTDALDWDARTSSFGPSFRWPILNYGRLTNAVRAQDARFQEALTFYQETVLQAQREVEDALVEYVKSHEREVILGKAVAAARKALDLSLIEYREGATDYTTVITAQQTLLAEEDSLAVAHGAVPQSLVSLYRSLGGGWELRDGKDFVPQGVKDEMKKRTDWGDLLETAPADRSPEDRGKVRRPDW